jgi:hypothetical protein
VLPRLVVMIQHPECLPNATNCWPEHRNLEGTLTFFITSASERNVRAAVIGQHDLVASALGIAPDGNDCGVLGVEGSGQRFMQGSGRLRHDGDPERAPGGQARGGAGGSAGGPTQRCAGERATPKRCGAKGGQGRPQARSQARGAAAAYMAIRPYRTCARLARSSTVQCSTVPCSTAVRTVQYICTATAAVATCTVGPIQGRRRVQLYTCTRVYAPKVGRNYIWVGRKCIYTCTRVRVSSYSNLQPHTTAVQQP